MNKTNSSTHPKQPTIKDVAKLAGVSPSAVSRAYTPGAYVSAHKRLKIDEAAKSIGYRPNLVARSLNTNRSMTIAVAITRLENSFHAELLQTITAELNLHGYRVLLFFGDPTSGGDPPIEEVLRRRVDGIMLCSVDLSSQISDECSRAGVPVVLANRIPESAGVPHIVGENYRGGRQIAAFLVAAGNRRCAYISGNENSSTSRDRFNGFAEFLHGRNLPEPLKVNGAFSYDQTASVCRGLFSQSQMPDALFCANDHMAIAAMDVARREFGVAVGSQLSIVGFDNSLAARSSGIDLTTFSQDASKMAQMAVSDILKLIDDPQVMIENKIVSGRLIVRSSARLPNSGLIRGQANTYWEYEDAS